MKKERRILFVAKGEKFDELANIAEKIGFKTLTKQSWLEGGRPYKDETGEDFIHCLVSGKDDSLAAFTMAFKKAWVLTLGHEFKSRADFINQLQGIRAIL